MSHRKVRHTLLPSDILPSQSEGCALALVQPHHALGAHIPECDPLQRMRQCYVGGDKAYTVKLEVSQVREALCLLKTRGIFKLRNEPGSSPLGWSVSAKLKQDTQLGMVLLSSRNA